MTGRAAPRPRLQGLQGGEELEGLSWYGCRLGNEQIPGARGAGDEEAHVVQWPPGTGLRPGLLRALRRRDLRLELSRLRRAVTAAQLSAHDLARLEPLERFRTDLQA